MRKRTIWTYTCSATTKNTTIIKIQWIQYTFKLKSRDIEKSLKQTVSILGQDKLGIPEEHVG
jgi:hypothetical protein